MDRFWKSLRSKFWSKHTATVIDGLCDEKDIANRFANVFQAASVPNTLQRHHELESKFHARYAQYTGKVLDANVITVAIVQECIKKLQKGKAPGMDDLTSEHYPLCASYVSCTFIPAL